MATNLPIESGTEQRSDLFRGDKVNVRIVRLDGLTEDPTDAGNGDIWYRSDNNTIKVRLNGSNVTIQTV